MSFQQQKILDDVSFLINIKKKINEQTWVILYPRSREEFLQNLYSVMVSFGISLSDEDLELPKLCWIPKLHKNPYKRYITGSAIM